MNNFVLPKSMHHIDNRNEYQVIPLRRGAGIEAGGLKSTQTQILRGW